MSSLEGVMLGDRYRVESLLGRGGMADVYRGEDVVLARPVAIKVLTDRDERERERFTREARSMAKLNHRGIVSVYDAGRTDDHSYIVMELVDGRTMNTIPSSELTTHVALRRYVEILRALQYAHESGVIHRDVKPANVMVLASGHVKVMDFGLARNASDLSSSSSAGEIVGTIAYLPPERFLGRPADARGDLYSVGVMLYETFTGVLPFKNESDDLVAVIFGHVNEVPVAPRTVNRSVPVAVDRLISRLLEKEPERRHASAAEVADELEAMLSPDARAVPAPGTAAPAATSAPESKRSTLTDSQKAAQADARAALEKTFARSKRIDIGYGETLAGMLAARKSDWQEGARAYKAALGAFREAENELEFAKTALKYALMLLQKNKDLESPDKREVHEAVDVLSEALPIFRGRKMLQELEDGERLLYALQRQVIRTS
jgi:hypothetical protein